VDSRIGWGPQMLMYVFFCEDRYKEWTARVQ
jgi:hypothetical protein